MATKIVVYKPDKPEQFLNVTDVSVDTGVLTFCYKPSAQSQKKIVTTVPFFVEEDIAG